ncbi:MAG: hypothetical protein LBD55_02375 [Treponema sp.]|jgi:hypothetical protein|nr:hypothetical protein [Treponema sp.]
MKKYEVTIYYSGFCSYVIEAESAEAAIEKGRGIDINTNEILTNLENWKEADTAGEIK